MYKTSLRKTETGPEIPGSQEGQQQSASVAAEQEQFVGRYRTLFTCSSCYFDNGREIYEGDSLEEAQKAADEASCSFCAGKSALLGDIRIERKTEGSDEWEFVQN